MRYDRIVAAALAVMLTASAAAETALIATPGGKLNVRKAPGSKSKLQMTVPNGALVEAGETEGDWTHIEYKGKEGYVLTEYLRLPSMLAGQTVFPDDGRVILYTEKNGTQPAGILGAAEAAEVLTVEDGWVSIRREDGGAAWTEAEHFLHQHTEPAAQTEWISRDGLSVCTQALLRSPEEDAEILAELSAGAPLTVTLQEKDWVLAEADGLWGWLPAAQIWLTGAHGGPAVFDDEIDRDKAALAAEKALRKVYKPFAKSETLFSGVLLQNKDGREGLVYHCCYSDRNGRCLYEALVDAVSLKVLFTAEDTAFSDHGVEKEPLPQGTLNLRLSAEELPVGGVLDIDVESWTDHACTYELMLDGRKLFAGEETKHFRSAFRPKQAGEYSLCVTVTDDEGFEARAEAGFTVTGDAAEEMPEDGSIHIYSQKDGWWLDKEYRMSNLDQSGCAIFTLSHALQHMGHSGPEILPEALAVTFAKCLTVDGTNNGRLIREAAEVFGFKTQKDLFTDVKKIRKMLQEGDLFSFSVARGHIALINGISADGSMVHVIDSAPSATFERIQKTSIYTEGMNGGFRPVSSLDEVEGARWYLDTDAYGGLAYWMDISYAAKRGVRLIRPE